MIAGVVNLGRDNDARLVRLRTALALGTGFQLVLVEAEPGPIRREVIRRIQTWSGHDAIAALAVVSLDAGATLAAQLGGKSGAIVTGLEPARPGGAPARDWIAELNWSRDALPGLVPGPLILAVSQAMHHGLFERAPDLYSWRRHTARVAITARDLAAPLSSPGDRYWLEQRDRLTGILAEGVFRSLGRTAVLLSLADVLSELGDERGASRVLDEAARSTTPSDGNGHELALAYCDIGRAGCALVRGDLPAARKLIDEVAPVPTIAPLLRGKLHAVDAAWDSAVAELVRAVESARRASAPHVVAHARECLCQVALARGDIAEARREIARLVEVAGPHMDEWGAGMLLRLATAAGEVYPDEIGPLLDAVFTAAESASRADAMVVVHCLRARRAWSLDRAELARAELARATSWIDGVESEQAQAWLSFCEACVALAAGYRAEDEVAVPLARARERFRAIAPRQAAIAGALLGEFWRNRGLAHHAVTAYRVAAEDARTASARALAAAAELGELGAAVQGEIEQGDACHRLRALAERFRTEEHSQSEGLARADLGRCLARRGSREAAVAEIERARACFEATGDMAAALSAVQELATLDRT